MAGMPTQEELFDLYRKNNPVRRNVTGMPLGEGFTPYKQKDQTGPELVTGLESFFNAEGPDALGTMISIPGYNGGLGSGRLNAINSMGLDSGTRQFLLVACNLESEMVKTFLAWKKLTEKFKTTPFFLDLTKMGGLET